MEAAEGIASIETAHTVAVPVENFAALYRATFREVYAYLFHRCGGIQAVAEDLTHETYVAAVAAYRAGDEAVVGLPWLIGVARHKLIDHFRRQERERRRLALVADNDETRDIGLVNTTVSRDRALAALAAVPAAQRAVLVLRYLDDMSVPEVARTLGKTVHATESLLARGRNSLKRCYREGEDD